MRPIILLKMETITLIVIVLIVVVFSSLLIIEINNGSLNGAAKNGLSPQTSSSVSDVNVTGSGQTVKVLIYDGYDTLPSSIDGIKGCLNYVNFRNSIPNVKFVCTTSNTINSSTLSSYDVLIMPGGSAGSYLKNSKIDSIAIKNFVASGKGYVGICAGSYAASYHIDGEDDGWGIAPDIKCKAMNYTGQLPVKITSSGVDILKCSGVQTMCHWNGPAMYKKGNATTLATYADSKTGYMNYDAIVVDNYGSGRVVLSGSHPELYPFKPEILARMIFYASKKG